MGFEQVHALDGLHAQLRAMHAREAFAARELERLRELGVPEWRIGEARAEAERTRAGIQDLQRRIRDVQLH